VISIRGIALVSVVAATIGTSSAFAAGTTGTVVDTGSGAVGVAHCEEEDVSRNGTRTAQLTGVLEVTGAVASVSITCKVIQGGVTKLSTSISLPGSTAVAPTKTGTLSNTSFVVCGYGSYQSVLTTTPKAVPFKNPAGC